MKNKTQNGCNQPIRCAEVTETQKKWTVLRNEVGCKISGCFSEKEITKYTETGKWTVAQIGGQNGN